MSEQFCTACIEGEPVGDADDLTGRLVDCKRRCLVEFALPMLNVGTHGQALHAVAEKSGLDTKAIKAKAIHVTRVMSDGPSSDARVEAAAKAHIESLKQDSASNVHVAWGTVTHTAVDGETLCGRTVPDHARFDQLPDRMCKGCTAELESEST